MYITKTQLRKIIKEELNSIAEWEYKPSGLREMDRETLDLYDQAIRLDHERLVGLIEWLKDYRDNPNSARTN